MRPAAQEELLLGNGAIALGLLEAGVSVAAAYPGTPSTEILQEVIRLKGRLGCDVYTEWSVNEKIAYDVGFSAAMVGRRAAVVMKQVGLNVAADSLFSTAYIGVEGGLVIVVCDDPGPHSSQTEQDTRFYALMAKVPVLDPATPAEARAMAREAFELSERHQVPVILRPTLRICHAREPVALPEPGTLPKPAKPPRFKRDIRRWAATPRARLELHGKLNVKLDAIRDETRAAQRWNVVEDAGSSSALGIIASGTAYAAVRDCLSDWDVTLPVLKVGMAHPFPRDTVREFLVAHERVLVLEEPGPVIETQMGLVDGVLGRTSGHVPSEGELLPEKVAASLVSAMEAAGIADRPALTTPVDPPAVAVQPPTLCPGCGHRAAFWGIRDAFPKALFPSDIGCYTLGLNLRAVDTVIDMGAGITVGSGLFHAFQGTGREKPIVATIGDSTFFHSGLPSLLNAVVSGCRFVLVILDNGTIAMTGRQPTPASGRGADGGAVPAADIPALVAACGVNYCVTVDPFDYPALEGALRAAGAHVEDPDGGMAVVIAKRSCVLDIKPPEELPVNVTDDCTACSVCLKLFECPSLVADAEGYVSIDPVTCIECGSCVPSCPHDAIVLMPPAAVPGGEEA
ncbi:MAG: thiamine pyrophosphate-dependent enzyme [Planctomycetota bacterium]